MVSGSQRGVVYPQGVPGGHPENSDRHQEAEKHWTLLHLIADLSCAQVEFACAEVPKDVPCCSS
jgi:hypothetical protein